MVRIVWSLLTVVAIVGTLFATTASQAAASTNINSVTFSVERGYITGPITVELSGGSNIVYSTQWGDEWLAGDFASIAQPYTGPITISDTTQLRAMATGDQHVVSHTYVDISDYSANDRAIIESYPAVMTTAASLGTRDVDARTIVEFWQPNGTSASAPAGIRNRQSGTGQDGDFRLFFRGEYGDGRLDYELFPGDTTGAQSAKAHDKVNLHGGSQDALSYRPSVFLGCTRSGTLMRDRFFQGLQREINGDGVIGQYYVMWDRDRFVGVKNAEDVPHQGFMEEHFGGEKDDYGLWTKQSPDLPGSSPYFNSLDSLDLVNYADYVLVQWFSGNGDWASDGNNNNVNVAGRHDGPFYHWAWDMHFADPDCKISRDRFPYGTPNPRNDDAVRMMLADRAYLHLNGNGAMTAARMAARWDDLAAELGPVIPLVDTGLNNSNWNSNQQNFRSTLAGNNDADLYSWMQSRGYASTVAPVTYSLPAGAVPSGSVVSLSGGSEIWFTVNGTDPRAKGGAVSAGAQRYVDAIDLPDGTVQMLARVKSGGDWSAARPMVFQVGSPGLIISEANSEYVELTNNGVTAVDLAYWRLQGDVRFKFDHDRSPIIASGESVIIAEDADTFTSRWGVDPDGQFLDAINGSEPLRLVDTELNTQHEVWAPVFNDGAPGNGVARVPFAANPPGLILNEWNAVSNSKTADEADPLLGTVVGNGGDWFELVTVNDTDIRGWDFVISDTDSFATIELTNHALWADLPAGAILTFSQDPVIAQDGTVYGTDTSFDPDNGDWWIHIVTNESNAFINQGSFAASADAWNIEIRNAANQTQWGPVGEGLGALLAGVGKSEVGELEASPSPNLDPVTAPYDDGNGSTFGAPNAFGNAAQAFDVLRGLATPGLSIDCDNTLTDNDALLMIEHIVNNRTNASCPLANPETQLNAAASDINNDGQTSTLDALIITQCVAGINNVMCPPPGQDN